MPEAEAYSGFKLITILHDVRNVNFYGKSADFKNSESAVIILNTLGWVFSFPARFR